MLCGECEGTHNHTLTLEKKNKIQMISFIAFPSQLIEFRRPREKSLSQFFNNTAFICGVSTYRWSGGVEENHSEPHFISGLKVCAAKSWFHIS